MSTYAIDQGFLGTFWAATGADPQLADHVRFHGAGDLPSIFPVTSFAAAAMGAAGLALASLNQTLRGSSSRDVQVDVDRRLASVWFGTTISPVDWSLPPSSDAFIGDYATSDGWIRLHTNAPHHQKAALLTLGNPADRPALERAVRQWRADDLEAAIVENKGCAATMRSWEQWQSHPQGAAVINEPLIHRERGARVLSQDWRMTAEQPLAGLRVLDMTRVLAGPACTRMLAGAGAEVLRIDPPWWDEPGLAPEMTLGKRCARLDLRKQSDRDRWVSLLAQADVLVHGYRGDALEKLGLGGSERQRIRPGLVDVSLDAYGHTGPWRTRRGFDSLVQMSMGVAHAGQLAADAPRPVPLPVQALDHATGYLMATAALRGIQDRVSLGYGSILRVSLARTGVELMQAPGQMPYAPQPFASLNSMDYGTAPEATHWGPASRARWPLRIPGVSMQWVLPAGPLGQARAEWARYMPDQ